MASQRYSEISQKLYLARVLLMQISPAQDAAVERGQAPAVLEQAFTQGCSELLLRARKAMLALIAEEHQHKTARPETLAELRELFDYDVPDIHVLTQLASTGDSWWSHLDRLDKSLSEPVPVARKPAAENVIAVSANSDADSSPEALERTRLAMARFLEERKSTHSEW